MRDFLVYLAGPITGLSYNGSVEWRETVSKSMPSHIHTLSPMRGKQRLELVGEEVIKDVYEDNPLTSEKGINARDFFDCKRCDLLFVNLLGATKVSIGTVMEIAWAKAFQIPIVLVMEKENIHNHAMVRNAAGFIVYSIKEAIELSIVILSPDSAL